MPSHLVIRFPSSPPLYLAPKSSVARDLSSARRFPVAVAGTDEDADHTESLRRRAADQARDEARRFAERAPLSVVRELGGGDVAAGARLLEAAEVVPVSVREVFEEGAAL